MQRQAIACKIAPPSTPSAPRVPVRFVTHVRITILWTQQQANVQRILLLIARFCLMRIVPHAIPTNARRVLIPGLSTLRGAHAIALLPVPSFQFMGSARRTAPVLFRLSLEIARLQAIRNLWRAYFKCLFIQIHAPLILGSGRRALRIRPLPKLFVSEAPPKWIGLITHIAKRVDRITKPPRPQAAKSGIPLAAELQARLVGGRKIISTILIP